MLSEASIDAIEGLDDGTSLFYAMYLLRIMTKLKNDGQDIFDTLPNGKKRYFKDLLTHKDFLSKYESKMDYFDSAYYFVEKCLKNKVPEKTKVMDIFGRAMINSLALMNESGQPIGTGLYLGVSAIDHSCAPNAVWILHENEMIVRAIENVDSFENIRITYLSKLFESTYERQKTLSENYFFDCDCSRCQDQNTDQFKSSLICSKCQNCVPYSTKKCCQCKTDKDSKELEKFMNLKTKLTPLIDTSNNDEIEFSQFEQLYTIADKVFHPFDEYYIVLLNILWDNYWAEKNIEKCLEIIPKLMMNYYHNYPKYFPIIGFKEITYAYLCKASNSLEEARSHIGKAEEILQVSLGEDHPRMEALRTFKKSLGTMP